jgi:hypothetical protein
VGGLRPRDPVDIAGPRPLAGVVGRPLNFTVRSHFRKIQRREEQGAPSIGDVAVWALADSVVLRASSFDASVCVCGQEHCDRGRGARPAASFHSVAPVALRARRGSRVLEAVGARLTRELCRLT